MSQPSGSPRSQPPATPQGTGAPMSPPASPQQPASNASGSPRFRATPRSGGESPMASPLASPAGRSRPAMSPLASPAGSVRTPGRSPGSQRRTRVSHRAWMGSPPASTPSSQERMAPDFDATAGLVEGNFLYGTDINENEVVKDIHKFIRNFQLPDAAADRSHYLQQLDRLWEAKMQKEEGIKFPINGEHVFEYSKSLYDHLVSFPTEVIPIFDREMWNISVRELQANPEDVGTCQVQVHSLLEKDSKIMRSMNPTDIERLVSVKGIVIRCSDLVPDMMSAVFRCQVEDCKNEVAVPLSHWMIEEPTRCEGCGSTHSFQIIHNECSFSDKQILKLQETPESVPEGETPQNVAVCCFDDLVDQVRPGDRVEVTGIYRASPVRPIRNWKSCNSVYRTYIDAIAIAAEAKGRIDTAGDEIDLSEGVPNMAENHDLDPERYSEDDVVWNKKVRALAEEKGPDGAPTIVSKLVQSFAPSIYEEDSVKRGLLCQIFGGTAKAIANSSKGRCRPEINSLLCGDPSTAKSQLLQYAYKIAPRGIYTSGKGSSAVGLTASINRDPITKELVLESGALVLSDRGVCCIDEFDKMDDNARAILHEAMEQQTVSVAKAGIVCSLNARTSILASANPKESAYDPKISIVENINLPKNLMTRFDFIWLMLDKRNQEMDRRLAAHLVSMYSESGVKARAEPPVDSELFRRYVSFAKRWVFPELSDAASEALIKAYADLRNQGNNRDTITATPRILESLIRISESLAKMELRASVTAADVAHAVNLLKEATYAAAIDPETGLIDMQQLVAGMSAAKRKRAKDIESILAEVLSDKSGSGEMLGAETLKSAVNERLAEKKEQLISDGEFNNAMSTAVEQGLVRRQGKQYEAI